MSSGPDIALIYEIIQISTNTLTLLAAVPAAHSCDAGVYFRDTKPFPLRVLEYTFPKIFWAPPICFAVGEEHGGLRKNDVSSSTRARR